MTGPSLDTPAHLALYSMRLSRLGRSVRSHCAVRRVGGSEIPGITTPICQSRPIHSSLARYDPPRRKSTILDLPPLDPSSPSEGITYEPLPRSLPFRRALLLLRLPVAPRHWPARLELHSELLSATSTSLKGAEIAVNAVYDGQGVDTELKGKDEIYPATLYFGDGKVFQYDSFDLSTLESNAFKRDVGYRPEGAALISGMRGTQLDHRTQGLQGWSAQNGRTGPVEVYVCTHGSRDCRCADRGGPLFDALRDEVRRRGLGGSVKIGEIAHVGGHKYAANALTLPSLDMFSNLSSEHAPELISHVLGEKPTLWANWRGRYGLSEEDQAKVWESVDPTQLQAPVSKSGTAPASEADAQPEVVLRFKTWEGEVREVKAKIGQSLLEVGKAHVLPSLEGTCGGNLECATCHLYLPESPAAPVDESSDEEFDMLGYAVGYRDGESRLGCQIKVTRALGEWAEQGGVIGLPRF